MKKPYQSRASKRIQTAHELINAINESLVYCPDNGSPETGYFRRLHKDGQVGDWAGSVYPNGRRYIGIRGSYRQEAHLVFVLANGWLPETDDVEHRDMNKLNNTPGNLRVATRAQNQANRKKFANTKFPYRGIQLGENGKFRAVLKINGKLTHLGTYEDIESASAAVECAAIRTHGQYYRCQGVQVCGPFQQHTQTEQHSLVG